jgi:hypothetical protein
LTAAELDAYGKRRMKLEEAFDGTTEKLVRDCYLIAITITTKQLKTKMKINSV